MPEVSLDGQTPWHRTGTSDNWGRLRQKTGVLVLFGVRRQGYSTYEVRADGLPIWAMSDELAGPGENWCVAGAQSGSLALFCGCRCATIPTNVDG
jgi:hypothetical protein